MKLHRKPQNRRAIKRSISMPLSMFVAAEELQQKKLLPSFSDLIQLLIRERLEPRA